MSRDRGTRWSCLFLGLLISASSFATDIDFTLAEGFQLETVLQEPQVQQPLSLNFDERGRLWVVQYLQFPFPAGLKVVGHDKYWRIQYDKFPPPPPPHGVPGLDKVTIYEDTNGDGQFDAQKDFVTGLNIATSALPGRGGIWVMNPPYLLFYPDANQDDIPDSDPIVHLEGFGLEDLHAVSNGLRWGPDGWLYGYQGSTTTATITRPGMNDAGWHFKGQNMWRYHPEDKRFELFMEGGQNNFGIAMDAKGRMFTGGNGGILGFHAVQGGYYSKNWPKHGELTNPYAYGFFGPMKDHGSKPKLSQGMVSYDAPQFPEKYQDYLFTLRGLKRCVSGARLEPQGSTYATHEEFQLVQTDDPHFRPVAMTLGPDGALYIADWHDTNITWNVSAEHDRTLRETGRVYRVTWGEHTPWTPFDLGALSSTELLEYLKHPNKWYRQTALWLLYDRKDTDIILELRSRLAEAEGQEALEILWAMHASGDFGDSPANETLRHPDADVRRWTIQLLGNDEFICDENFERLLELARDEEDPQVRSQLASTARRLDTEKGLAMVEAMLLDGRDEKDLHIPMLLWWAVEEHIRKDRSTTLAWCIAMAEKESRLFRRVIVPRLGQRFTQDKTEADSDACAMLLESYDDEQLQAALLDGIAKGLGKGGQRTVLKRLHKALEKLIQEDPDNTQLMVIAARLGNDSIYEQALQRIQLDNVPEDQKVALIQLLSEAPYKPAQKNLLQLFTKESPLNIRKALLSALQRYSDDVVGQHLLDSMIQDRVLRERIAGALVSRKAWAILLLKAVDDNTIPVDYVDRDLLINLAALNDAEIDALVHKHWGTIRTSPDDKIAQVNAVWATLKNGSGYAAPGREVYEATCAKCHVHLGVGRKVGPDLTGLNRRDTWDLVTHIIDPSSSVLPEYAGMTFTLRGDDEALGDLDEQVITGFILRESDEEISLVDSAGNEQSVVLSKVKSMTPMTLSIMPEGLITHLPDQDLRDLFAFIEADTPPEK